MIALTFFLPILLQRKMKSTLCDWIMTECNNFFISFTYFTEAYLKMLTYLTCMANLTIFSKQWTAVQSDCIGYGHKINVSVDIRYDKF